MELGWTPGGQAQAEDRVHGIGRGREGQRSHCRYLVARGTVEEKLLSALQRKSKVSNAILDGGRSRDFDFDILREVTRNLIQEGNKA